jgi:hypothetical protein
MNDPVVTQQRRAIDPVQAGQEEAHPEKWAGWLVVFLRVMAGISMIKGLYHWAIVCGIDAPNSVGFDGYATPFQSATVFFAVIDLVAAVGLWLAAPWGAVVWLTSVISMVAVELLFPQIYGGQLWLVGVELLLLAVYLVLALLTAREQPS